MKEKKQEDLPLFVDVEVIKRDEETGELTKDVYPLGDKEVS